MKTMTWMTVGATLILAACGDEGSGDDLSTSSTTTSSTATTTTGGGSDACDGLCTSSGFDGGTAEDFMNGLIECTCSGGSGAITQDNCAGYCSGYDVPAEKSYLSESAVPNDKCVCDGTTPP